MKFKTLFLAALGVLLALFVFGVFFYYMLGGQKTEALPEIQRAALVRMHSPTLGKVDAPVIVVEFLDPACETCARFYPLVKEIMAAHPDKIRLVLRYAPFHKGSDEVVAMLEAARKQGKFWPALEALLSAQAAWVQNHTARADLAWNLFGGSGMGLDMDRLRVDMAAPEIARAIAQDVEDAKTLNVRQTPEFFVNGRPLPEFGIEQLKRLINDALVESAKR